MSIQATERGADVYSPLILKIYDWWVLRVSSSFAWQAPVSKVLMPFFRKYLSPKHLDVGVGTGYYLANATQLDEITLLDLNQNSLNAASARINKPVNCILHDVFKPLLLSQKIQFDSISLFYLLHCLPGSFADKEQVIINLKAHLSDSGILYGVTVLGDNAQHNFFGRILMTAYNRKGIFSNKSDNIADLQAMLERHFMHVEVLQQGKVALFMAENRIAD